jgi:hypothetical protein
MNDMCLCGQPYSAHEEGYCQESGCDEFRVDVAKSPPVTREDVEFIADILDRDHSTIPNQERADAIIEKLRQLFP